VIRREFRTVLEKRAAEEAERREQLGAWEEAIPPSAIRSVKRAAYWQEVATQYSNRLSSEERRKKVEGLVKQFEEAQAAFNEAYKSFQEAEAQLSRQNSFSQVIQTASNVAGLIENACRIKAIISSGGRPVEYSTKPQMNLHQTADQTRGQIRKTTIEVRQRNINSRFQEKELMIRDSDLRQIFVHEGIPIPKSEEPIVPKP
jgi:exonuclease VII small subunit